MANSTTMKRKSITKTNYFRNLKRKANIKDLESQIKLNKELLNVIERMDEQIDILETQHFTGLKQMETQYVALSEYVTKTVVPYIRMLAGCIAGNADAVVENPEENNTETKEEGGEMMDAT